MTSRITAQPLLRTAQTLAGIEAGRGRPRFSDLRRATSTAYYAVFHQLLRHGALDFLPSGGESEWAEVARWFTHSGLRRSANWVALACEPRKEPPKDDKSPVMILRTCWDRNPPSELLFVADTFSSLQDARHQADYDGNYDPTKQVTINHVDDAEAALKSMDRLWRAGHSKQSARRAAHKSYLTFLRLALLASGGPRRR